VARLNAHRDVPGSSGKVREQALTLVSEGLYSNVSIGASGRVSDQLCSHQSVLPYLLGQATGFLSLLRSYSYEPELSLPPDDLATEARSL
jgi:hypothetical protein